jgi:hypothetical protein
LLIVNNQPLPDGARDDRCRAIASMLWPGWRSG